MDEDGKCMVAITRHENYDENLKSAVERVLSLSNCMETIKKAEKILLKPNMLKPSPPDRAVTTHPAIIRAVARVCARHGATIHLGDSPAWGGLERVAKKSGIKKVCEEEGIELVPLETPQKLEVKNPWFTRTVTIAREALDYDLVVNIPKLKTHSLTVLTGATKNLYGCVPGRMKAFLHAKHKNPIEFSGVLLDIARTIQDRVPVVTLVDGILGMEGDGPGSGTPREMGYLVAGRSTIAVDAVLEEMLGIKGRVPLLNIARKRRHPHADASSLQICGLSLAQARVEDFVLPGERRRTPLPLRLLMLLERVSTRLAREPVILPERCTRCGICAQVCPTNAIEHKPNMVPKINRQECIKCYCCHESCPSNAIVLRRRLLG